MVVPEGQRENSPAFQFNAGNRMARGQSPEGTVESWAAIYHRGSAVPFGTRAPEPFPAFKRRAIVICPSGTSVSSLIRTKHTGQDHFFNFPD